MDREPPHEVPRFPIDGKRVNEFIDRTAEEGEREQEAERARKRHRGPGVFARLMARAGGHNR